MKKSQVVSLVFAVVAFVLVVVSIWIEQATEKQQQGPLQPETLNMSKVITKGNFSFVPLLINGPAHQHMPKILGAVEVFEKTHPTVEVMYITIITSNKGEIVKGILLAHQPREKSKNIVLLQNLTPKLIHKFGGVFISKFDQ